MFTEQESRFIIWWEANRDKQKRSFKQFLSGFSKGIGIGMAIVLIVVSGWYLGVVATWALMSLTKLLEEVASSRK